MTTSRHMPDIVSENVAAITNPPTYSTSEQWEENLNDNTVLPHVFLERPLRSTGKITVSGHPQEVFDLDLFFCGAKHRLDDPEYKLEDSLKVARELLRQFLMKLSRDGRIIADIKFTTVEQTNFLDINAAVIYANVKIVVDNIDAIC